MQFFIRIIIANLLLIHFKAQADEDKYIKVAYYENFSPFSIKKDNILKGIFVEYIEFIFSMSDEYKVISDAFPWERAQDYVRKGSFDSHVTLKNQDREKYLAYSKTPVYEEQLVLIYSDNNKSKKEIEKINNLDQLKKFEINDYIGNGLIKNYPAEKGFKLNLSSNIENSFLNLSKNKGDVIITSRILADIEINQKYPRILKYKNVSFLKENKISYYFMVRKSRKDADNIISVFENNIKLDKKKSKLASLYKKYIEDFN